MESLFRRYYVPNLVVGKVRLPPILKRFNSKLSDRYKNWENTRPNFGLRDYIITFDQKSCIQPDHLSAKGSVFQIDELLSNYGLIKSNIDQGLPTV